MAIRTRLAERYSHPDDVTVRAAVPASTAERLRHVNVGGGRGATGRAQGRPCYAPVRTNQGNDLARGQITMVVEESLASAVQRHLVSRRDPKTRDSGRLTLLCQIDSRFAKAARSK